MSHNCKVKEQRFETGAENETGVIRWKNDGFQFILETLGSESSGSVGDTTTQTISRKILQEIKNETL